MIIVLHGENTIESRKVLVEKIKLFKEKGEEVVKFGGKKVDLTTIKQACEARSFFGSDRLVVIERFFTRPKSRQKTGIENYIQSLPPEINIIFWEEKKLTPSQLKKFPSHAQIHHLKVQPVLFRFLDSLRPGNNKYMLTLLLDSNRVEAEEMIFYMLCRQIRLLIMAKDANGKSLTGMPFWMKNKFINQSRYFSLEQLLEIHRQLLKIDYEQKTGRTIMPLSFHLDLLVATL